MKIRTNCKGITESKCQTLGHTFTQVNRLVIKPAYLLANSMLAIVTLLVFKCYHQQKGGKNTNHSPHIHYNINQWNNSWKLKMLHINVLKTHRVDTLYLYISYPIVEVTLKIHLKWILLRTTSHPLKGRGPEYPTLNWSSRLRLISYTRSKLRATELFLASYLTRRHCHHLWCCESNYGHSNAVPMHHGCFSPFN